jgi:hypothetical protein
MARSKTETAKGKSARTLTARECSEELELPLELLRDYMTRGCPHDKGGRGKSNLLNADEVAAWMQSNNLTGEPGRPTDASSPDIKAARLRELNLRCRKHELDVAEREKRLLDVDAVKRWIGDHVTTAKNKLIGLGASITPQLEGRDAAERQTVIDARVTEILEELASVELVGS